MEDSQKMVQQVSLEKFADFRDTVISVLNNRLRDSDAFKQTASSIDTYKNIQDTFAKIKR